MTSSVVALVVDRNTSSSVTSDDPNTLIDRHNSNNDNYDYDDEENDDNDWFVIRNIKNVCISCRSIQCIRIDWSQGDRICIHCGVVQEQHIIDYHAEWRDYGNRDDHNNNNSNQNELLYGTSRARSGLIPNNEMKYIGGLQPTTLSKYIYNGSNNTAIPKKATSTSTNIVQRLRKVHRKIDYRIEQNNKRSMKMASHKLQLLRKQYNSNNTNNNNKHPKTDTDTENTDTITATNDDDDDDDDLLPDYGSNVDWMEEPIVATRRNNTRIHTTNDLDFYYQQRIQEQEYQVQIHQSTLYSQKWSLDRALWLFGNHHDNTTTTTEYELDNNNTTTLREEIEKDIVLYTAAQDIYTCYTMIYNTCHHTTIQLVSSINNNNTNIIDECMNIICQYATKVNGFKIKGIATTTTTTTTTSALSTTAPSSSSNKKKNNNNNNHNALMVGKRWGRSLSKNNNNYYRGSTSNSSSSNNETMDVDKVQQQQRQVQEQQQSIIRQNNKIRQMASLCAATIFWMARYRNKPRSIISICDCMMYHTTRIINTTSTTTCTEQQQMVVEKVTRKHCSRALQELKSCFPELSRLSTIPAIATTTTTPTPTSTTTKTTSGIRNLRQPKFSKIPDAICVEQKSVPSTSLLKKDHNNHHLSILYESMNNMIDHTLHKLHLPPVAEASVRYLVFYYVLGIVQQEQEQQNDPSGINFHHMGIMSKHLPIQCAAITYMISTVGTTMKTLAKQAQQQDIIIHNQNKKRIQQQQQQQSQQQPGTNTNTMGLNNNNNNNDYKKIKRTVMETKSDEVVTNDNNDDDDDDEMSFHLFTDDNHLFSSESDSTNVSSQAIPTTSTTSTTSSCINVAIEQQQREYEMRRMWDCWLEQLVWDRSIIQIEQSMNVSRKVMLDYYKQHIYPIRYQLLNLLCDSCNDQKICIVSNNNPNSTTAIQQQQQQPSKMSSSTSAYSVCFNEQKMLLQQTPLSTILLSNIIVAASLLKESG